MFRSGWDSGTLNDPLWHGAVELLMFHYVMGQWSFQSSTLAWDSVPLWHTAVFHSDMGQWSFECSTMAWGCGAMNVPLWRGAVALSGISVQCGIYAIGKSPYALHPFSPKLPQHCL